MTKTTDRDRAKALIRLLKEIDAETMALPTDLILSSLLTRAILRIARLGGLSDGELAFLTEPKSPLT